MATEATIETEVRLTIQRMTPTVAALAHATGEEPKGNRRARRKAAAEARKGVATGQPARIDQSQAALEEDVRTAFADACERSERARDERLAEMMSRHHRNCQYT